MPIWRGGIAVADSRSWPRNACQIIRCSTRGISFFYRGRGSRQALGQSSSIGRSAGYRYRSIFSFAASAEDEASQLPDAHRTRDPGMRAREPLIDGSDISCARSNTLQGAIDYCAPSHGRAHRLTTRSRAFSWTQPFVAVRAGSASLIILIYE
jgi:hypothetical protein